MSSVITDQNWFLNLPFLFKVIEMIVNARLDEHMDINNTHELGTIGILKILFHRKYCIVICNICTIMSSYRFSYFFSLSLIKQFVVRHQIY